MKTGSQTKVALTYGAMLGLANVIVYMAFYFGQADPQSKYPGLIGYLLTVIFILYGIKNYRDKERGGFIPYSLSLGTGVLIGLFAGIISAIFTVLMFTVIDPDMTQKIMAVAQQKMADKSMTEEQIQTSMTWTKKFMSPPFLFVFALLGSVFMSFIFSLVISIFMKKDQTPFESQPTDAV